MQYPATNAGAGRIRNRRKNTTDRKDFSSTRDGLTQARSASDGTVLGLSRRSRSGLVSIPRRVLFRRTVAGWRRGRPAVARPAAAWRTTGPTVAHLFHLLLLGVRGNLAEARVTVLLKFLK